MLLFNTETSAKSLRTKANRLSSCRSPKHTSPHIEQSTTMVGNPWWGLSTDHARDEKELGILGIGKGEKEFGIMFVKFIATS